jgi:hypothetical protein
MSTNQKNPEGFTKSQIKQINKDIESQKKEQKIKDDKLKSGPEGFTKEQIKQINENQYINSHTITELKDVQKRLEGMNKSKEYNKNLKISKDNIKKMREWESPIGSLYTKDDTKYGSIFVKK